MDGNNIGYLFAAFGIIWLMVFIYVFILLRREKSLRREIAALKEGMKKP